MSPHVSRRLAHRYGIAIDGDGETFQVMDFTGEERLSSPYHGVARVSSRRSDIDLARYLEKSVVVTIIDEKNMSAPPRRFQGVVSAFRQETPTSDDLKGHSLYTVEFGPRLVMMAHTSDCRIFQRQSVRDIVDRLLSENNVLHVTWRLGRALPDREFCCQYQETDLTFFQRLLAEEGIWYYFEHTENEHTLVLCDHNGFGVEAAPASLSYNGASGGNPDQACISHLAVQETVGSGRVVQRDFTFRTPHAYLETAADTGRRDRDREFYIYPGRYKNSDIGRQYASLWLEEARTPLTFAEGPRTSIP